MRQIRYLHRPGLDGVAENESIDRRLFLTSTVAFLTAASAPPHRAWAAPSWEALGGRFNSPPASWGRYFCPRHRQSDVPQSLGGRLASAVRRHPADVG
jgi:hypothetical protein